VNPAVSERELFKNWVFFQEGKKKLFTSLILLNIVKNTRPMRKVMGNELEVYLFSFKLRSDGQLQVQCFSQKWHITENLKKWNLRKINENNILGNQTSRIGPKPIK
jgi:uncharacterized protein affecting Mg2+/Co2+ transport